MYHPLSLCVGLRYTRAKRTTGFISFISIASMVGIALGVMVLITVLSVMNGFDTQIKSKFFSLMPSITVSMPSNDFKAFSAFQTRIEAVPGVAAATPYVQGLAMLSAHGQFNGVYLAGIDPARQIRVNQLKQHMVAGDLTALKPGSFGIVLGASIAKSWGLKLGDKVTALVPQNTASPIGAMPRTKRFRIVGLFKAGDFGYEGMAYMALRDAQVFLKLSPQTRQGLWVKADDVYHAVAVSKTLQSMLPAYFSVSNWTEIPTTRSLFKALAMEKTMMFMILLLIIMVAAFNLVSGLVMLVNDKASDVAILRTLGATPALIMRIFMVQGCSIGFAGTAMGVGLGVLLSYNITAVANMIQKVFHVQLISASVYWVDYLPSRLAWSDVAWVTLLSLALSFLATVYPSWMAFRIQPAEALRYE